ncbi:hypothetical protein BHE74_00019277 [Ensete ventricosum]|nr:hypothetical protein GW17_00043084 [Ensete ventricosum]RWW72882.1 hypothetical protein BHE74_00019277 [Ensete ventricosum]RZR80703.1 hypothetical protein BHM03_00006775 [Ensete ventricosum]
MVGPQWPAPPPLLGFTRKRGAEEGGDRKSTRGEVDADNDVDRGVVRCYNAEDTITISHIEANPIAEEVVGVKVHDLLLCP